MTATRVIDSHSVRVRARLFWSFGRSGLRPTLRILHSLLVFVIVVHAGQRPVQRFASSDKRLIVHAIGVGHPGFEKQESRIEVRTRSGRLLAVRDFHSRDGQHGFGIAHGEWTANDRWFVFNVESSGGHQPWHRPTYAFDRRSSMFYALDDYVGPVMSDFTLIGRESVGTTRMNVKTGAQEEPVVLNRSLHRLQRSPGHPVERESAEH